MHWPILLFYTLFAAQNLHPTALEEIRTHMETQRYSEAEPLLRHALQMDLEPGLRLHMQYCLGTTVARLGRRTEAEKILYQALAENKSRNLPRELAGLKHALGLLELERGNLRQSAHLLEDAVAILTALGESVEAAKAAIDLSALRLRQGQQRQAYTLCATAQTRLSQAFGESHAQPVVALYQCALIEKAKDPAAAESKLHRVLHWWQHNLPQQNLSLATIAFNLAELSHRRKSENEALSWTATALASAQRSQPEAPSLLASIWELRAAIQRKLRQTDAARDSAEKAASYRTAAGRNLPPQTIHIGALQSR